jgi:hypothetical protein
MRFLSIALIVAVSLSAGITAQQPVAVQATLFARGSFSYKGEIGPPSKAAPFSLVLTVRDDATGVLVTEAAQLPGGRSGTEEMTLDASTLAVRKRSILVGETAFDLTFTPDSVRGTVTAKGLMKPVEFALNGELFADGGGAFAALGALPLRDGLRHTFYNLDLSRRGTSVHHARVTGPEKVIVEAGEFQAFRIELAPDPPGPTNTILVWIDASSRVLVKVASDASRYELITRRSSSGDKASFFSGSSHTPRTPLRSAPRNARAAGGLALFTDARAAQLSDTRVPSVSSSARVHDTGNHANATSARFRPAQ